MFLYHLCRSMGGQWRDVPCNGVAASIAIQSRSSDVLPLPIPHPGAGILRGAYHLSRAMRRRLHSQGEWQAWANDAVRSLDSMYGSKKASGSLDQCSAGQLSALKHITYQYQQLAKPPAEFSAAGAFIELCGSALPYLGERGGARSPTTRLFCLCPRSAVFQLALRRL